MVARRAAPLFPPGAARATRASLSAGRGALLLPGSDLRSLRDGRCLLVAFLLSVPGAKSCDVLPATAQASWGACIADGCRAWLPAPSRPPRSIRWPHALSPGAPGGEPAQHVHHADGPSILQLVILVEQPLIGRPAHARGFR